MMLVQFVAVLAVAARDQGVSLEQIQRRFGIE